MSTAAPAYPFGLDVDAPSPQSRLTVLFRLLLAIPHILIVSVLSYALGLVTFIAWFAIVFTGKYPSGMLGFAVNIQHWATRSAGYIYLLSGAFPPFTLGPDDSYAVRMTGQGVAEGRSRVTVFFRLFMLIPHAIVLYFVGLAVAVVWIISWFAALFTGSVPEGMHNFLVGGLRWGTRVNNYALLLNDEYPPFSLS